MQSDEHPLCRAGRSRDWEKQRLSYLLKNSLFAGKHARKANESVWRVYGRLSTCLGKKWPLEKDVKKQAELFLGGLARNYK